MNQLCRLRELCHPRARQRSFVRQLVVSDRDANAALSMSARGADRQVADALTASDGSFPYMSDQDRVCSRINLISWCLHVRSSSTHGRKLIPQVLA